MADIQRQIAAIVRARANERGLVVILDRIELGGPLPEYCTHGRVTCGWCDEWCWLGHATHDKVANGEAAPICHPCASRLLPKDAKPVDHVRDHRRADGPHP